MEVLAIIEVKHMKNKDIKDWPKYTKIDRSDFDPMPCQKCRSNRDMSIALWAITLLATTMIFIYIWVNY